MDKEHVVDEPLHWVSLSGFKQLLVKGSEEEVWMDHAQLRGLFGADQNQVNSAIAIVYKQCCFSKKEIVSDNFDLSK